MVVLAVVFLLGFAVMMATGSDREPDADPGRIIASYDTTLAQARLQAYALMALCGVLVFLGAALRSAVTRGRRHWTGDVALAGFVLLAMTYAGFGVSTLVLQHAVEIGDRTLVAAANLIDTSNFLPAMASMICLYAGTGLTALQTGSLPRWLAWTSVVLGVLAPLGPGGFAPFVLLPLWAVAVAVTVRLDDPQA
jgi:hypothetical protein